MTARKMREMAASAASTKTPVSQPPYHSDISDAYLAALQRQIDSLKPAGFKLTPISEPGW